MADSAVPAWILPKMDRKGTESVADEIHTAGLSGSGMAAFLRPVCLYGNIIPETVSVCDRAMVPAYAAAPLTSLMLMLALVTAVVSGPSGFPVVVPKTATRCMDDIQQIVVTVRPNHTVQLNNEPWIDLSVLGNRLQKVFLTRADRTLFVRADPGISFQEFVDMLDSSRTQIDRFGLVTPGVTEEGHKSDCGAVILWLHK
jgi:biopolymer transport protein ExbD